MKRLLFIVVAVLGVVACKTPCANETVLTGGLTSGIALALQCQNRTQIQQDVTALLAKANVCTLPQQPGGKPGGPIALLVCPVVSQAAVSLLGSKIPASWECSPALATEGVAAAITGACTLLPF